MHGQEYFLSNYNPQLFKKYSSFYEIQTITAVCKAIHKLTTI